MNKLNYLKSFLRIQINLYTCIVFLKIFSEYVWKKPQFFAFLVLLLILADIFGSRENEACCLVFAFPRDIPNAMCDLELSEGWNISLIYDGSIQFQYFMRVVVMQDSTLSDIGSQFTFSRHVAPIWEREC